MDVLKGNGTTQSLYYVHYVTGLNCFKTGKSFFPPPRHCEQFMIFKQEECLRNCGNTLL